MPVDDPADRPAGIIAMRGIVRHLASLCRKMYSTCHPIPAKTFRHREAG
jgi:hypothetical protein